MLITVTKYGLLILVFTTFSFKAYSAFDPTHKAYQNFNLQPSINCIGFNQINLFSGLSHSERLQKLYDGTIEKELIKVFYKNKNDLDITSSLLKPNTKGECFKTKNVDFLKGLSNSERLQKIYDGSLEKEYLRLNP